MTNLSARDKKILSAIVPVLIVLAYWFLVMAPKREAAAAAQATLQATETQLLEAQARAGTVQAAEENFARDYASVVALGKAIPATVDMPSLLVQLERAAHGTGIEIDGVTPGARVPAEAAGTTAPPAPATGAASPAGAPAAASPPAAGAVPPAAEAPAAATPVSAGGPLESVPLEFRFTGSFFELADFFHSLKRFVYVSGDRVRVRGRLMTINSVAYEATPETFPELSATVTATVFLSPKAEGVTAGATPAGPSPAAAATAPVSSASSSPPATTPTAAATP